MKSSPPKHGDIVTVDGEELEFVVFEVGENQVGIFPRYRVEDVDDRIWDQSELDWKVIGKRPLQLSEWYNPAARFDNEEATIKYGVTFRQFISIEQVLEITEPAQDTSPEIGQWVLIDDKNQGLICGVVEKVDGTRIYAHFVHHKCAKKSGHWGQVVEFSEVLLVDSTYQAMYEKGSALDE